MPVEINIEDALWGGLAPEPVIEAAALATLAHLAIPPEGWLVNVLLCDDSRIRVLNADFRGKDKATNVLSWPAWDLAPETPGGEPEDPGLGDPEEPEELGDIAIARETMQREAEEQQKPFSAHLSHLTVHSILHLLGYDHETEADALLMEGIERAILAGMGIADPYA